jgi:hypothetical protein
MLGDLIYEEKGTTTGVRVLESENGSAKVEVSIQTEGKILGVEQKSIWSYWSETRADGSVHGDGKGFMTTKDGALINLVGSGVGKAVGDGFEYRGTIYFHTSAEKYSHLNTIAGVHEYDVDGAGNTVIKVWEWK